MRLGNDDALWGLVDRITLVDCTAIGILDGEVVGAG